MGWSGLKATKDAGAGFDCVKERDDEAGGVNVVREVEEEVALKESFCGVNEEEERGRSLSSLITRESF